MNAGYPVAEHFSSPVQQRFSASLGMWVFLATEVLFFGVLFTTYFVNRLTHPAGFLQGAASTDLLLGSVETAVLLTSSFTAAMAEWRLERGWPAACQRWLLVSLLLGVAFTGIHGIEYLQDWNAGLLPPWRFSHEGPYREGVLLFHLLYVVMTGFHLLHLVVGLAVLGVMLALVGRGRVHAGYATPLRLSALYWSFVDLVWIFLFPLLYLPGRS